MEKDGFICWSTSREKGWLVSSEQKVAAVAKALGMAQQTLAVAFQIVCRDVITLFVVVLSQ